MKKKEKRKSRSANSFLRHLLTCGGIVPNCAEPSHHTHNNNNNSQSSADQQDSSSDHNNIQVNCRTATEDTASRHSTSSRNLLTGRRHHKGMSQNNLVSSSSLLNPPDLVVETDDDGRGTSTLLQQQGHHHNYSGCKPRGSSTSSATRLHHHHHQDNKNHYEDEDDDEEEEEYEGNEDEEEEDADDDLDDEEEPYDDDDEEDDTTTKKNNLVICKSGVVNNTTTNNLGKKVYESDDDDDDEDRIMDENSKKYSAAVSTKKLGDPIGQVSSSSHRGSRNNSNRSSLKLSSSANPIICTPSSSSNVPATRVDSTANTVATAPSSAGIELNTTTSSAAAARQIPSFSFQVDADEDPKAQSNDDLLTTSSKHLIQQQQHKLNQQQQQQQQSHLQPSTNAFYSKFLTGSNIITDRGCIVNVRTGSFNLGCGGGQNSPGSSALSLMMPPYLNDTELINSDQFFSSLDHQYSSSNDFLRNSASNYSVRTSFNSSLDIRSSSNNNNNNNNYRASSNNVLIPLLLVTQCRKKSLSGGDPNAPSTCITIGGGPPATFTKSTDSINICGSNNPTACNMDIKNNTQSGQNDKMTSINNNSQISNSNSRQGGSFLLSANDPQDQFRRCSHDPNIEKLHKNYINNVKLIATAHSGASGGATNSNNLNSSSSYHNTPSMFSSASVSSANTDSIPNVSSLNQQQHFVRFAASSANNNDQNLDAEKSDQVYDIGKVNTWLKDNTNNNNGGGGAIQYKKRPLHYFTSTTISEDEDNYDAQQRVTQQTTARSTSVVGPVNTTMTTTSKFRQLPHQQNEVTSEDSMNNKASNDEESELADLTSTPAAAAANNATSSGGGGGGKLSSSSTYEASAADSAIDMRSCYGSLSIHSKASSSKSRTNWQSFSKSYRLYFQSSENTWSKYQISAMSLEQIMSLRKLALIQFSKLVERQHSNMIRKLRIFSKKLSAAEFQKVYDSIDSVNGSARLDSLKSGGAMGKEDNKKSGSGGGGDSKNHQEASVVIDSKKVSHQLGAQMGMYPQSGITKKMAEAAAPPPPSSATHATTSSSASVRKKQRGKNSIKKKDEKISTTGNLTSTTTMSQSGGGRNQSATSSSLLQQHESHSRREFSSHNYSTVSNEESSSSIILDYDYVNMTFSPNTTVTQQLLESEQIVDSTSTAAAAATSTSQLKSGGGVVVGASSVTGGPFGGAHKTHKHKTFGLPLNVIMQLTGQPLPQQIIEAMRMVRRTAPNEIGIFRKNGNKARINKLRELIDKHESINFQTSDLTIFDIADTIKLYFRELPECLITNKLSNILLSSYSKTQLEERKNILQQVMLLIPDENRLVLQTLLLFLNDIAKHHKTNQMTRTNLAVVFSPVIFSLDYTDNKKKLKAIKTQMASNYSYSLSKQPTITTSSNPLVSISSISSIGSGEKHQSQSQQPSSSSVLKSSLEQFDQMSSSNQTQQSTPTESPSPVVSSSMINNSDSSVRVPKMSSVDITTTTTTSDQRKMAKASFSQETKSSSQQSQDLTDVATLGGASGGGVGHSSSSASKLSKYSDKINKAANSFVSFGGGGGSGGGSEMISKESLESFESMNKVVQSCVADMIKYSMDLFTVPIENFEKLRLSICGSEPHSLDSLYDLESRRLKKVDFFAGNVNIDKTFWSYFDKFDDVSIYYFKNEYQQQQLVYKTGSNSNLTNSSSVSTSTINNQSGGGPYYSAIGGSVSSTGTSHQPTATVVGGGLNVVVATSSYPTISSSLFIPQANECFSEKLKLWKCCTLVKKPNLTLDKILNRIKKERYLWDDDFKDGRIVEQLDDQTEIYRYVMSFLPPHPSRDFFELRHTSTQKTDNQIAILTSISVKKQSGNKLVGDIRANMFISKYVIEQLIATDTTTTFKITHYIKLDYKGFTLEFYNRTFGYMMARLLYNLKMSLTNPDTASPPPPPQPQPPPSQAASTNEL